MTDFGIQKAMNLIAGTDSVGIQAAANTAAARVKSMDDRFGGTYRSGYYYWTNTGQLSAAALAQNILYTTPFVVRSSVSISKIGTDVTIAGGAGSVVRIGIWSDTGNAYPNALLLDAGTIDGTSATVQDITLGSPTVLSAGLYWVGTCSQVGTAPTLRTHLEGGIPIPFAYGTTKPTASSTVGGYYETPVAGAFTGTFTSTVNSFPVNQGARVHFKVT